MPGQKYQHPKNKDENDWMPSSCLTNKITRFCYNFLLKFKFAAATKQEAFFFLLRGKNKEKRQHVWKLRRTSAKSFCNPMVSWFRMRQYFCVWVKVKHLNLSTILFTLKQQVDFVWKIFLSLGKGETYWTNQHFFLKTNTTLFRKKL